MQTQAACLEERYMKEISDLQGQKLEQEQVVSTDRFDSFSSI